jgi:hypothetical protein
MNHHRVEVINAYLTSHGLTTWFDSINNKGNMKDTIADAISSSHVFLVFLTSNYNSKISKGIKENDWCYLEYNYATRVLVPENMLLILLEPEMKNRSIWSNRIQLDFAHRHYREIFFDDTSTLTNMNKESLDTLVDDIKSLLNRK